MKPSVKYLLTGTVVMTLAVMTPAVVLIAIDWKQVAGVAAIAAMSCYLAAALGGIRIALLLTLPLAIASALAFAVASNAWAAAVLMAVVAGARGLCSRWGYSGALTMAAIGVAFIVATPPQPQSPLPHTLFVGLVVLVAGLYATVMVYLLRRFLPPPMHVPPVDAKRAWAYAVVLGLLVGIATWFIVDLRLGHPGAWIVLTLIIVVQPYVTDEMSKALSRAGGTVLGFLIAMAVGLLVHSPTLIAVIGEIALITAVSLMSLGRPYWQFACGITVAMVLFSGASSSVPKYDVDRLGATLIGIAMALVVVAILAPLSKRYSARIGDEKF